jgi:cytochrome c-type biogenesis protein CcmH/NrfG
MLPPIEIARRKTGKVQQDLQVASAELGLAHEALEQKLPPEAKHGDVAWAIGQNAAVEQKVQEAAQELKHVTDLLHEEEAERARLEQALAHRGNP